MTPALDALLPVAGERVTLAGPAGEGRLESPAGAPLGRFALRHDGDTLFVSCLQIDDAHRGYGAGSEAARLIATLASESGYRSLAAWAPPSLGLAVYFWLRMGLRPEAARTHNGGITFRRELES